MPNEHEAPFSGIDPARAERLYLLAEECAELQHKIMKTLRHGMKNYNPLIEGTAPTNQEEMEFEAGDIMFAMDLCFKNGDMNGMRAEAGKSLKSAKVWKYLHHNTREKNWEGR